MSSQNDFTLVVKDGHLRGIYNDNLAEFLSLGKTTITRASHVEPHPDGGWIADMTPAIVELNLDCACCANPVLGPFALRQQALDAETAWLEERMFH